MKFKDAQALEVLTRNLVDRKVDSGKVEDIANLLIPKIGEIMEDERFPKNFTEMELILGAVIAARNEFSETTYSVPRNIFFDELEQSYEAFIRDAAKEDETLHVQLRNIRAANGELLKDMADKLEMSSAELSAIETGNAPTPPGFMMQIRHLYDSE